MASQTVQSIKMLIASLFLVLGVLLVGHFASAGPAETTAPAEFDLKNARESLEKISENNPLETSSKESLESSIKEIGLWRTHANECVLAAEQEQKSLQSALDILPKAAEKESKEVAEQRKSLASKKNTLDNQLSGCQLFVVEADQLNRKYAERLQSLLSDELFLKEAPLWELATISLAEPERFWQFDLPTLYAQSGLATLTSLPALILSLCILLSFLLGTFLKHQFTEIAQKFSSTGFSDNLSRVVLYTLARYIIPLLIFASLSGVLMLLTFRAATPFYINIITYGLLGFFLMKLVIRVLFDPPQPGTAILPLQAPIAKAMANRLHVLAVLIVIGFYLLYVARMQSLPQPFFQFGRGVFMGILCMNLIALVWLMHRLFQTKRRYLIPLLLSCVFIATWAAEWWGYHNLSLKLFAATGGSIGLLFALWLSTSLINDLCLGLDVPRHQWQQKFRKFLGLEEEESVPGLLWLRFISILLLWGIGILYLLQLWGLPEADFQSILDAMKNGFKVADVHVVPLQWVVAFITFSGLLTISHWLKSRLEKSWLEQSRMDRGAKEAVASVSGYIGFIAAVIVGLGVAGVNFSSLLILASALSVGVGFGLQNIVNNFISGLILLFERPVTTGDWVVVGKTEGYVQKISIRSTRIRTFDRSDVIVPNSELVTQQVTNWMLHDPYGRIIVPINVAHGTDTQKIKEILLRIAFEHPEIIKHGLVPEPRVLFIRFGDSGLNFELRAFLRHIDRRSDVISDINFEIERSFRENGIEIPFPQREMRVRQDTPSPYAPPPAT